MATKSSGTILHNPRLATAAVYIGVHEDGEPTRNAVMASAVLLKQLLISDQAVVKIHVLCLQGVFAEQLQ